MNVYVDGKLRQFTGHDPLLVRALAAVADELRDEGRFAVDTKIFRKAGKGFDPIQEVSTSEIVSVEITTEPCVVILTNILQMSVQVANHITQLMKDVERCRADDYSMVPLLDSVGDFVELIESAEVVAGLGSMGDLPLEHILSALNHLQEKEDPIHKAIQRLNEAIEQCKSLLEKLNEEIGI